jgi:hypothetical protein
VAPDLVEGTLRRGYETLDTLTTPTQRGAFVAFLVAEVHPFDEGNGRLARAVMNAEYVAGSEQRAIITTITRNDYLRALRRLIRQDQPDLFVTYLDRVRQWTGRMDWSDREIARAQLEQTNAFIDGNDAEDRGVQLLDPVTGAPAIISGSFARSMGADGECPEVARATIVPPDAEQVRLGIAREQDPALACWLHVAAGRA